MRSLGWRRMAIAVPMCCVAGGIAWFFVARPCLTYYALCDSTTTGRRYGRLASLKVQGPLGRHFARRYASEQTRDSPSYGHYFLLYNRGLLVGMKREDVRQELGPPDEVRGDADMWHIGRREALQRLNWDENYAWEVAKSNRWYEDLAAEYENGALVRFGNPVRQTTYLDEIERSPYQTRLKVDVDPKQLDRPPPEWSEAQREVRARRESDAAAAHAGVRRDAAASGVLTR